VDLNGAGPVVTYPVEVIATAPQTCALTEYQQNSSLPALAYVYSEIDLQPLSGNPPSYLTGTSVFKVCS
jgi:hypothetical protein